MITSAKITPTPVGHGFYKYYVAIIENGQLFQVGFDSKKRAIEYCKRCSKEKGAK